MKTALPALCGLLLLTGGGCVAATADGPPPAPSQQAGMCSNENLAQFTGQKATTETGALMLKVSGARTLRWGGPGMALTMDFRADRLTVSYDEDMVIDRASCG